MSFALSGAASNFDDCGVCKFCPVMLNAFLTPMRSKVGHVFGSCSPSKIADAVVSGIAVDMETFHVWRLRANKRLKHHVMQVCNSLAA
jgi:hypothetical protein